MRKIPIGAFIDAERDSTESRRPIGLLISETMCISNNRIIFSLRTGRRPLRVNGNKAFVLQTRWFARPLSHTARSVSSVIPNPKERPILQSTRVIGWR